MECSRITYILVYLYPHPPTPGEWVVLGLHSRNRDMCRVDPFSTPSCMLNNFAYRYTAGQFWPIRGLFETGIVALATQDDPKGSSYYIALHT